ncbi:prenylcysteine oxidase-like [Stegodyphus dumicola]|uniref:prenylcysteine oxidase-like n=1 Tax=Stegodyphus dumicola TaxID=202533 RepID=UPI0015AB9F6B|nr:prenylcysteine oxidase-like [Stegodyphus dumicola]
MLEDFNSIYALQEKEYSFTTVNGLLEYMSPSFRNLTQESIGSYLMKKGYPKLLLEELVQSVMMVNYGQTNKISAFAGFVSLAGADNNLWSVKGGNKLVPEGLLKESKASVVSGDVLEIINSGDTFSLKYNETSPSGNTEVQNYDIIIIAAPFIKGNKNIKFTDFPKDFSQYETTYHRTVATFVKGDLIPSAFNVNSVPEEILTFKNSLLFNSIGKVTPVSDTPTKGKKKVYKVFSQQLLTPKNIDELFQNVEILKEKDWLAYPEYKPPESLSPFMLYPRLYYINSIELSASAMEMSAVAGKNVALLAFNLWHDLMDKVDSHKRVYKDEL